jgi:hypothetical protein
MPRSSLRSSGFIAALSTLSPSAASQDELRLVHERVATYYGLDLRRLERQELQRLAEAHRRRRG